MIQSIPPPHRTDLISPCSTFVQLLPSNEMTQWSTPPLHAAPRGNEQGNARQHTVPRHSIALAYVCEAYQDGQTDKQSEHSRLGPRDRAQETPARDPGPKTHNGPPA